MDREIIDYNIITGHDVGDLQKRVTESLKKGWVPQGGITLNSTGYLLQAVVRYKSPNQ